MNGGAASSSGDATVLKRRHTTTTNHSNQKNPMPKNNSSSSSLCSLYSSASFMKWTISDVVHVATHHWMPCLFACGLLFFMAVEYTLFMVPSSSPPFDLGFVFTRSLHRVLESSPQLNNVLAALNTVCRLSLLLDLNDNLCFVTLLGFFDLDGMCLIEMQMGLC